MKKKIWISIIVITIIIAIIFIFHGNKSGPEYVTVPAAIGDVTQTVDATGSVTSSEEIELNFKTTGRVRSLNVKVGDQIKKGQTLASLEATALSSKVTDARSALLEAQANLEKVLAGSTDIDIHISKIAVSQAEQNLQSAQNNFINLESKRDTEIKNLKNTAVVTLHNEILVAEAALETVDNTLNNDNASDTLGVLKTNSVTIAKNSYDVALKTVNQTKTEVSSVNKNSTDAGVLNAMDKVNTALDQTRNALSDTFDVLEATITSNKLTQTELDSLISGIQTKQTSVSAAKTNLQTAESNWTNKIAYYKDQLSRSEDAIKSAEASLELAKAKLDRKQASPENYDITAAKAKVAKAQANLQLALANLSDTLIIAPVDGIITEINNEIGEQTSLASPVIKMIGESNLEIEVDIPESDIAKINIGQTSDITLDSFGDDEIFSGSVTFIDPAETVIQDVVYYQVKVQFTDKLDKIKPGMTANVTIHTAERPNVLRVPSRAVRQNNGGKIVQILVNNQIKEKKVTTGLKGDDFIEIISGLSAGDEVITFIKNGK